MNSINTDNFLKYQGITVKQSAFLKKVLNKKAEGNKEEYNLRDVHGRRLQKYWQPGDTLSSVIWKLMVKRVVDILNPDTYTKQTVKQAKQLIVRQKITIFANIIFLSLPISFYFNVIKPKLNLVKRLYYLQFYNKMKFFNRELGIKTKPISQKDLQNNV